jgi:hypothetical protein
VALAAGNPWQMVLTGDGTVVTWESYLPAVPEGLSSVKAIAVGWYGLALKEDGTVVSWGSNEYGQDVAPAGLSGVVAIAAGKDYYIRKGLALKSDGTVQLWGRASAGDGQLQVPHGLSGVVAISAGGNHNLALVKAGPPVLVLLGDNPMTIECGSSFTDPGARATDVNGVDLTSQILVGGTVNTHKVGAYTLTYTVTIIDGRTSSAARTVNVVDTTSPAMEPVATPAILWPPNNKMVDVAITAHATDNSGGAVQLSVVQITCTEPPHQDNHGQPITDWQVLGIEQQAGVIHTQFRAQRDGNGPGRTYTITISATDAFGNMATANIQVRVPHDQGK